MSTRENQEQEARSASRMPILVAVLYVVGWISLVAGFLAAAGGITGLIKGTESMAILPLSLSCMLLSPMWFFLAQVLSAVLDARDYLKTLAGREGVKKEPRG